MKHAIGYGLGVGLALAVFVWMVWEHYVTEGWHGVLVVVGAFGGILAFTFGMLWLLS